MASGSRSEDRDILKYASTSVPLIAGIAAGALFTVPTVRANLSSQAAVSPAALSAYISYLDAKPIFQVLRKDLLPADLTDKTPAELESGWPEWVSRRNATIRARVEEGDEDSIINFLQFGTTFTRQPRITEHDLAGLVVRAAGTDSAVFLPSPLLRARIEDFVAALASPGTNERLQFAREVLQRHGLTPATEAGRTEMRRYLEERAKIVGSAPHLPTLLDPNADLVDSLTLFRDRGLSSDTSIMIDFGVEQALTALKAGGLVRSGTVRRVAIVGPGLDFTDKQEGYDFYPQQTIQPFAVIDSLLRLGLATPAQLQVTAFDLSPRVIQHLEAARARAHAGQSYALVLPRDIDQPWTPEMVKYWERFGDRIGSATKAVAPTSAGRVAVRSVLVRPSVVLSTIPRDVNIVLQRLEPASAGDQFDIILATNLLLYYDVFEQSLAVANVARMLRPGGIFLSNDRIFELPGSPVGRVGYTDAVYMKLPATGEKGDRIDWYQRQ